MFSFRKNPRRRLAAAAAFTLVELMLSATLSATVGLIVYGVASEGVIAFARNISINRSYSNARQSLDRIATAVQSAGHVPVLVDANGLNTAASPAAGIRFWRYSSTPSYTVNTAVLSTSIMTLSLTSPDDATVTLPAPAVGELVSVAAMGFQAPIKTVTVASGVATLTFATTLASNTSPVLSALPAGTITCLVWTPVAFIAVGSELRYYPRFISGTTSISNAAGYKVVANLISNAPALPFSLGPSPSINVDLYAEAPDYNNRNLGSANTYTYLQSALASRNPTLLRSPY